MLYNPSSGSPVTSQGTGLDVQSPQANGLQAPHYSVDARQPAAAYGQQPSAFPVCACGCVLAPGSRFCQHCGRQAPRPEAPESSFPAWGIASIICSFVALLFVPIMFGALGILFGFFAWRQNRGVGTVLMIAGGASIILGIAFAVAVLAAGGY